MSPASWDIEASPKVGPMAWKWALTTIGAALIACQPVPGPEGAGTNMASALPQVVVPVSLEGLAVHPDAGSVPQPNGSGGFVVRGACPGEYCSYGEWTMSRGVTLRRERPASGTDSVGYVPASRPVCADSGLVIVDPPGVVIITQPPPELTFATYRPPFAPGDTVFALAYTSEGYWTVRWGDSITIAYAYWEDPAYGGTRVEQPGRNFWWVHLTDRASGERGWVLRSQIAEPPRPWVLMEGGEQVGGERIAPCR